MAFNFNISSQKQKIKAVESEVGLKIYFCIYKNINKQQENKAVET